MNMKRYPVIGLFIFLFFSLHAINFYDQDQQHIEGSLQGKSKLEKIIILENYIKKQPKNAALYLLKAKEELQMGDYAGARDTALLAANEKVLTKELSYILGLSYYYLKEHGAAEKIFTDLAQNGGGDQTATFFLSLMAGTEATQSEPHAALPDIRGLEMEYLKDTTSDPYPYTYLLQSKTLNVKNTTTYDYVMTGIIKINKDTDIDEIKSYKLSYDSSLFTPGLISAGILHSDGSVTEFSASDLSWKERDDGIALYSAARFVGIPAPHIKTGDILYYQLQFSAASTQPAPGFTDSFIIGSQIRVYKKEYEVTYPATVKLSIIPNMVDTAPETAEHDGLITTRYTFYNPLQVNLTGETVSLLDISPSLSATTLPDWASVGEWFSGLFASRLSEKIELPDSGVPANETASTYVQRAYTYVQQNIEFRPSEFNTQNLHPEMPSRVLQNRYGDSRESALLLIALLKAKGITAYPALISSVGMGQPLSYVPDPYGFNHMIVYLPKQQGIDTAFFLDATDKYTAADNLPYTDQGVQAFVIKNGEESSFVETPVIDAAKNMMAENYLVTINRIGGATLVLNHDITGSFAEYFHSQIDALSGDERADYFYKMQKDNFAGLDKKDLTIEGIDKTAGDIHMKLSTPVQGVTEILFDGSQILNFDLGEIDKWIEFPAQTQYPYRKTFAYTYKKRMEFIFPEGYTIKEQNISNMSRDNTYMRFTLNADKIADNHFVFEYELVLKNVVIAPEDISVLAGYIGYLAQSVNFKIVMDKNPDFDYEAFFEDLKNVYKQPDVYKNYITKLLGLKKTDKAKAIALEGKKLFPKDPYFNMLLSMIDYDAGNYADAENELTEALGKSDNKLSIYGYFIDLYKKTGESGKLLAILQQAYREYPSENAVISELVEYYRSHDQLDQAIALLEENILKKPDSSSFYADLGYLYSLIKNNEKAESNLKKAVELDPENSYALNNLAWLYCEQQTHTAEAVTLAEKACSKDPDNENFLDTLAEAYYQNKNYQQAKEAINKALSITPESSYLQEQRDKIENALQNQTK